MNTVSLRADTYPSIDRPVSQSFEQASQQLANKMLLLKEEQAKLQKRKKFDGLVNRKS